MCCHFKILPTFLVGLLLCAVVAVASGQDVVVLKKSRGEGEVKRNGEIVSWIGDTISVKGKNGVKDFDTERLIRIETAWHPGFEEGKRLLATYRYDAAIDQFESALDSEARPWMQNMIFAKMVECYLAKEDFGNAASHYLRVIDDDPNSRFRHLAPLVWTSSKPNSQELRKAEIWLESGDPTIAMMGSSWLLSSNKKAKQKMELLASDFDPFVAALAQAQLWRLEGVAPDQKRMTSRIKQVQAMPEATRCGAWYLVAEAQSKSGRKDEAIINFMRIPVNDSQQGGLAAASLYQIAWLLRSKNQLQQSQAIQDELKEKFGDTVWAN